MNKKILMFFGIIIVFSRSYVFAQCAICKAVLENGDVPMAEGINSGIVYLMVIPYILIGLITIYLFRYYKKTKI